MIRAELIRRSPLRILERSTHGGLGVGNLGAISARKGVGKTACLVHIALDKLLQQKGVIHASFSANTQHIVDWYEDMFKEIARQFNLDDGMAVHDEIVRRRIIMNFNQEGIPLGRVIRSAQSMIRDGQFPADCIMVDGYAFDRISREELGEIRSFAVERKLEIWFSVSLQDPPSYNEKGVPRLLEPFLEELAVLIRLEPKEGHVRLELIKDHDSSRLTQLHLELDPRTLLVALPSG